MNGVQKLKTAEFSQELGLGYLFGERCAPLREFAVESAKNALDGLADDLGELLTLNESFVGQIYESASDDRHTPRQGYQLLQGIVKTVQALCSNPIDWSLAAGAVEHFDAAWPLDGLPQYKPPQNAEDDQRAFHNAVSNGIGEVDQRSGYWVVWDLIRRLRAEEAAATSAGRARVDAPAIAGSTSLPVLMAGERHGGVALLTVELIENEGDGFRPDVFDTGLTVLWHDYDTALHKPDRVTAAVAPNETAQRHSLLSAMQHAWRASGLAAQGFRGRWRFTRYPSLIKETAPLAVPSIDGRSFEAAVCCALWAAAKFDPRTGRFDEDVSLDRKAAISARLADNLPAEPSRERCGECRLESVTGWTNKLREASAHGVEIVIASTAETDRDLFQSPDSALEIVRKATVGEAFELLASGPSMIRAYQDHVWDQWRFEKTFDGGKRPRWSNPAEGLPDSRFTRREPPHA